MSCVVGIGKGHSLEVGEPELELEEISDADESVVTASDGDVDGQTPVPTTREPEEVIDDASNMEFPKPKMKVFHGTNAPGLRIRSAPSLKVRTR